MRLIFTVGAAALVVALILPSLLHQDQPNPSENPEEPPAPSQSAMLNQRASAFPPWDNIEASALGALQDGEGIIGFSLVANEDAPSVSQQHDAHIKKALSSYKENEIPASFLLMDIQTGRGFATNLDQLVYAASSFKGPYSAFVCSEYLDKGQLTLSTKVACDPASCPSGSSSGGKDTIYHLMEAAILYSSNEAYGALRDACSSNELSSWLRSAGIDGGKAFDLRLPFFTVRDMSKMWLAVYAYLQSEGSHASMLGDLYGKTEVSFIRSALESSEEAVASVMNKGGWYRPDNPKYNSVVDCGIVRCDDRDYLLCAMSSARWTQENVERLQSLISAVFAAREDLFS